MNVTHVGFWINLPITMCSGSHQHCRERVESTLGNFMWDSSSTLQSCVPSLSREVFSRDTSDPFNVQRSIRESMSGFKSGCECDTHDRDPPRNPVAWHFFFIPFLVPYGLSDIHAHTEQSYVHSVWQTVQVSQSVPKA